MWILIMDIKMSPSLASKDHREKHFQMTVLIKNMFLQKNSENTGKNGQNISELWKLTKRLITL